jgi:hypothetical protein
MSIYLATTSIDKWEVVGAISSTVSAIASLVAIPFVAIQLKSSNQIAKAQLMNELERDISLHADTYTALTTGGKWYEQSIDLTDSDKVAILKYISFFERVHVIVKTNVLDLETIDDIFAGRFFYLFNNPHVKQLMNTSEINPYMASIYELYNKWYEHRKNRSLLIPFDPKL